LILEAQIWLENSYLSEFRIDDLADRSNITRRTFERRFKIATGDSPLKYLQRVRIEAAKRLLEKGANTFDEITYKVGYLESSSFR
jgi:transcriptional regulator GlxA family with amidase domain